MFQWNDLSVTENGNNLNIDVQVVDSQYYKNVYIDSIYLDTDESYSPEGISSKAIKIFKAENSENIKRKNITVDVSLFPKSLFFVYVKAKGSTSDGTPCGMNKNTTIGVTWNKYPIYKNTIKLLGELRDNCNPSRNLTDWILRYNALMLCIDCEDYTQAIQYWQSFFQKDSAVSISKPCGCHG